MGFGDEILAAGQAQRLWNANPSQRVAIVNLKDKVRWHPIWHGNPILATPDAVAHGESVTRLLSGPEARPYIVYPFTEYTGWTFNTSFRASENIARIFLTQEELNLGLSTQNEYGPYVLIEPWSKHPNLRWPMAKWAAFVEACPKFTFIQHIHTGSELIPGVTAAIGASFREACGLLACSEVYIRGESGMLHAAAALGVPSIALWGGCMDWDVLGNYPLEVGIGVTPPYCGKWFACPHCSEIMGSISVDEVSATLRRICPTMTSVKEAS